MNFLSWPVNGGWGAWGSYGSCSKTCDSGTMTRRRRCDNPPPQHGGKACPGSDRDDSTCHVRSCCEIIPPLVNSVYISYIMCVRVTSVPQIAPPGIGISLVMTSKPTVTSTVGRPARSIASITHGENLGVPSHGGQDCEQRRISIHRCYGWVHLDSSNGWPPNRNRCYLKTQNYYNYKRYHGDSSIRSGPHDCAVGSGIVYT